jgi:hypothetical protein
MKGTPIASFNFAGMVAGGVLTPNVSLDNMEGPA